MNLSGHRGCGLVSTIAVLLAAGVARGQSQTEAADRHFRTGVAAFQKGDAYEAVVEFEAAYATSPHFGVLYNLGLAYAAVGRPVEAIATLKRYLEMAGPELQSDRRGQTEAAIASSQKRIGSIRIVAVPANAEVTVDGRAVDPSRTKDPILLAQGTHGVVVKIPGKAADARSVTVRAGETEEITLADGPDLAPRDMGALRVDCAVPDTSIEIDGEKRPKLDSSAAELLRPGRHRVRFARDGYSIDEKQIALQPGRLSEARCDLRTDPALPPSRAAKVVVKSSCLSPTVTLDDASYRGEPVPPGRHRVSVQCVGFLPFSAGVNLGPGDTRVITADLVLSPEARARADRDRVSRRTWAFVIGGTGLAFGATSAVLFVVNEKRSSEWHDESRALNAQLAAGNPPSPELIAASLDHQSRAVAIQRTGDIAVGTAIVGGALLAVSTVLFVLDASSSTAQAARAASPVFPVRW
jgi:tetratricopeptide (TPR) repeat protein